MVARLAMLACLLLLGVSSARASGPLLVFAAASLRNALDEVVQAYPGERPVVSYAGSSTHARHIEGGAPVGVFIAADRDWMDYLHDRGFLIPGTRHDLLGNRLVLVARPGSELALAIGPGMPLAQALGDGRLALAHPDHVPAGKYARSALERLGVWQQVKQRIASAGNVRAALALVARGEAPLGIVYQTDVNAEPKVRVVGRFDASLHPPIVYPMALVRGAERRADAFAEFLRNERAQRIFENHGFARLH